MRLARPYRLMAAFMAALLVFSSSLPLVQHVCAMTPGGAAASPHDRMHAASAPPAGEATMHHGMQHDMPTRKASCCCDGMAAARAPVTRSAPPDTPCIAPSGVHSGGDCCTLQAAPPLRDDVLLPGSSPRVYAPLVAVTLPRPADSAARDAVPFLDTGPPPASVPVYLACSVLLI